MSWTLAALPGAPHADAVALATSGGRAFAALADGRVFASDDAGRYWGALAPAPAPGPIALLPTPGALLLATCGGLFVGRDGGSWRRASGIPDDVLVLSLALTEAGTDGEGAARGVVAGTLRDGAFRSTDGGVSWAPANGGLPLRGAGLEVHALVAAPHGVYAAHLFGVHRSADGGASWAPPGTGLPLAPGRTDLATDGRAAFASVDGRLFETADGAVWDEVFPDASSIRLVSGGAGALFAVDRGGALVTSRNGGVGWASAGDGLPGVPEAVAPVGPTPREALLAALGPDGLWRRPPVAAAPAPVPPEVAINRVAPNPAARWADLTFSISAAAEVVLTVHDPVDREVARVVEGRFEAGRHHVRFVPNALPAGLYRCRLRAGGRACARPLVLLTPEP